MVKICFTHLRLCAGLDVHLKYLFNCSKIKALKTTWNRHYKRDPETLNVTFKPNKEAILSEAKIESPYDTGARFRTKRETNWTGYMVHLTETCENDLNINVVTHVRTTAADVHDIHATQAIQKDLYNMGLNPREHIVDTGYLSLSQLVKSKQEYDIDLIGPVKEASTWRSKTEDAYTLDKFKIDWTNRLIHCPQGKCSANWKNYYKDVEGYITAIFSSTDCKKCEARDLCIGNNTKSGRKVNFPAENQFIAKKNLLERLNTAEGKALYE